MSMTAAEALERNRMYATPTVKQGVLTEKVITCEVTGRKSREWSGDKAVWMNPHKKPVYIQLRINKEATAPHGGRNLSDFIKG